MTDTNDPTQMGTEQDHAEQHETVYSEAAKQVDDVDPTEMGTQSDHAEKFETGYSDPEGKSS